MAEGTYRAPDDSGNTGPTFRTYTLASGTNTLHTSLHALVDESNNKLALATADPATNAASVPVRIIPATGAALPVTMASGTVSATVANFPSGFNVNNNVTLAAGTNGVGSVIVSSGTVSASIVGTVPVSGTFWQATQPVSAASLPLPAGAATESTLATLALEGASITGATMPTGGSHVMGWLSAVWKALTDRLPAALTGSGNLKVSLAESTASQAVTGTFWQTTQPVSGPLTDTQLRATAVPVSGPLTDTQLRATALPVSFSSGTASVSVSNFPSTQTVNGSVAISSGAVSISTGTVTLGTGANVIGSAIARGGAKGSTTAADVTSTAQGSNNQAMDVQVYHGGTAVNPASIRALTVSDVVTTAPGTNQITLAPSTNVVTATLGNSTGKTNTLKTGTLVSTATTADQVILTYTVTALKTFYLTYFDVTARLTTFATTATYFGLASLESPSGTKLYSTPVAGAGIGAPSPGVWFAEPIPIAAGTVIRIVCTPAAATSYTWQANFGGYDK